MNSLFFLKLKKKRIFKKMNFPFFLIVFLLSLKPPPNPIPEKKKQKKKPSCKAPPNFQRMNFPFPHSLFPPLLAKYPNGRKIKGKSRFIMITKPKLIEKTPPPER